MYIVVIGTTWKPCSNVSETTLSHGSRTTTKKERLGTDSSFQQQRGKRAIALEGTEEKVMEEAQTTSCSVQMAKYALNKCPYDTNGDIHDNSSDDDEIVEGLNELALDEQMDQNSPESFT
jgi:hypothetical protein